MFGRKSEKTKIKREAISRKQSDKPNYTMIMVIIAFLIVGLLMIFSASAVLAYVSYQDTFFFLKKQLIWIAVGAVLAFIVYKMPRGALRKMGIGVTILGFILLVYMFPQSAFHLSTPGVVTLNGATRWIRIPNVFDIQPAELMKIVIILFTSFWLTLGEKTKNSLDKFIKKYKNKKNLFFFLQHYYILFPVVVIGLVSGFILLQRDLDTIVVLVLIFLCIYYVGGTKKQTQIVKILLVLSLVVGVLASVLEPYRRQRVESFLEIAFKGQPNDTQGASFQAWNGLVAIGSGGLFGVGYGNSRQKLFFLQEAAYTDSIFAVYAEEFGLAGTILLVLGYIYFLSLGLQIARKSNDKFLCLIAIGVTSWITIQALLNIAANLAVIPFGGMPLPFLTYGGSNTIAMLFGIGLLLNASRKSNTSESGKDFRKSLVRSR